MIKTIKEKRVNLQNDIHSLKCQLTIKEGDLELLTGKTQPETSALYNGIEEFFTVEINHNMEYEHILGGDGRSAPWSEQRTGKVAKIRINNDIWLNADQTKIILKYIEDLHQPDYVMYK